MNEKKLNIILITIIMVMGGVIGSAFGNDVRLNRIETKIDQCIERR